MNKTLILTAVTNSKDNLTNPYIVFDNCDYIAYTDKKYNVKTWEQRSIYEFSHIDNFNHRRNAKIIKVLSTILFPEYEYIVWVDANRQLIINPEMIYNEYGDDFDLLLFKHGGRNCLYQEFNYIKNITYLENQDILINQIDYYLSQGMPLGWGLFEMPTFIVKNTQKTKLFQMMWWEQICKFSSRDQISLPYVLWKLGDNINYKILKGNAIYRNEIGNIYFLECGKHLKKE